MQTLSKCVRCKSEIVALAFLLATAFAGFGQPVLVTPPSVEETQKDPFFKPEGTNATETAVAPTGEAGLAPAKQLFQYGPVTLHPHASYSFTYSDGLQSSPGNSGSSIINTLSPGIGFDLGQHWQLDYSASASFYSDSRFRNSVDHSFGLNGATTYDDWSLQLSQAVAISADPQSETAQQTDRESYNTVFSAGYQLNSAVSLDMGLAQSISDIGSFTNSSNTLSNSVGSSRDWSGNFGFMEQFGPNLGCGAVGSGGFVKVENGSDRTYENFQGRVSWRITRKVSFTVSGGISLQQYQSSGTNVAPDFTTPIFAMSLRYHPLAETMFTLSASRSVGTSFFQNQVTESTSFNATLNQQVFQRFSLGLTGGFANTAYRSSVAGATVARNDNYSFVSASLSTRLLKRGSASLSYSRSMNSSNQGGLGYNSNQLGLQLSYSY